VSISEKILLVSSVIIGLGVIFTAIKKTRNILRNVDKTMLLMEDMTLHFGNTSNSFQILQEIIAQFRTDSGSSLKDQINRIENSISNLTEVARKNEITASVLEGQVSTVKELSALDRRQGAVERARIMSLLQYLEAGVATGTASSLKAEETATQVAKDLANHDAAADAETHSKRSKRTRFDDDL
jgi:hypothetical protein